MSCKSGLFHTAACSDNSPADRVFVVRSAECLTSEVVCGAILQCGEACLAVRVAPAPREASPRIKGKEAIVGKTEPNHTAERLSQSVDPAIPTKKTVVEKRSFSQIVFA